MKDEGHPTRSRPGLSRERVVRAAVELADTHGIEALSMRKLAGNLGVEAMSLYNHVKNKDDLVKAMLNHVTDLFSLPAGGGTWQAFLRHRGWAMYHALVAHPWASMTLMSTFYDGAGFLVFMDRSYGFLGEAGFSLIETDRTLNAVDSYTYGFVLQKLTFPVPDTQMQSTARKSLDLVRQDRLPNLHALTTLVARGEYDGQFDYEYGLETLIAGLESSLRHRQNGDAQHAAGADPPRSRGSCINPD